MDDFLFLFFCVYVYVCVYFFSKKAAMTAGLAIAVAMNPFDVVATRMFNQHKGFFFFLILQQATTPKQNTKTEVLCINWSLFLFCQKPAGRYFIPDPH